MPKKRLDIPKILKTPSEKKRYRAALKDAEKRGLSKAYARRLAIGAAQKKTRQQSRGHKPKEHVTRKQREIALRGLTNVQRKSIVKYYRDNFDPDFHVYKYSSTLSYEDAIAIAPTLEDMIDFAASRGYATFSNYRKIWSAARRSYLKEEANGEYLSRGEQYLEMLRVITQAPEVTWLYYH